MSFDLSSLCVEQNMRECGERIADCPAWVSEMERETRTAVGEYWHGSAVDYVTAHALALFWQESRMNRCAVGPGGRKVLGLKGNGLAYTEEEVIAAMSKVGRNARVDLGIGQVLFRYAKTSTGRATVADLIGKDTSVRTAIYNLHVRQRLHPRERNPWSYWPGNIYDFRYVRKIGLLAKRIMGGQK